MIPTREGGKSMPIPRDETQVVGRAIVNLHAGVMAGVCGLMGGLGLFIMTVWLVVKDGPQVGPHLQLLSQYFIGYSVTWSGGVIGFAYGALAGGAIGWSVGSIYNRVAWLRQGKPNNGNEAIHRG
jgi:hypothetical protein